MATSTGETILPMEYLQRDFFPQETSKRLYKKSFGGALIRTFRNSNEPMLLTDMHGIIRYINPAWLKLYRFTPEEVLHHHVQILKSGQHEPEFYRQIIKTLRGSRSASWRGELIHRAKDGTLIPVLLNITPITDSSGRPEGYMVLATNLTKEMEAETVLEMKDRLSTLNTLASGLAHEIGTPLGTIRGRAELMLSDTPKEQTYKSLKIIIEQVDRISKIVDSLLSISQDANDSEPRNPEPVRLRNVIDEVTHLVGQSLGADQITIKNQVPLGQIIFAQPQKLLQLLTNLTINSIQAIQQAIFEGRTQGHQIEFSTNKSDQSVILSIRDTGCGISKQNLPKIFRPFFTTKEIRVSTGLGLPIVHRLLKEINSSCSVTSTINQGTTFTLYLAATKNI